MLEHNLKSPLKSVDGRDTNDNSTSINKKEVMKEVVYNDDNFMIAQIKDEDRIKAAMSNEIFRLTNQAKKRANTTTNQETEFEHNFMMDESFMGKDM